MNRASAAERLLDAVFLAALAAIVFGLRLHSLDEPLERDLTSYAYVAHRVLEGEALYTDVWDHKPPAVYLAFGAAELLWGYEPRAIFLLGVTATLVSLGFAFALLRDLSGRAAAWIGGALWVLASSSIALEANQPNVEAFLNAATFGALWLFGKGLRGSPSCFVACGAILALRTTFKVNGILLALGFAAYLVLAHHPGRSIRARLGDAARLLVPIAVAWIAVGTYFLSAGRFADFVDAVFEFNRQYSGESLRAAYAQWITSPPTVLSPALADLSVLPPIVAGWAILGRRAHGPLRPVFFRIFFAVTFLEIVLPGRFYAHYYQLLLPLLCVGGALCAIDFFDRFQRESALLRWAIPASFLLVAFGTLAAAALEYLALDPREVSIRKYGLDFVESAALAEAIERRTGPGPSIYEWGAETALLYYTKGYSPTAYFYYYPMAFGPSEMRWARGMRTVREIERSPPRLVVWWNVHGPIGASFLAPIVAARYVGIGRYRGYDVYELRTGTAPPP